MQLREWWINRILKDLEEEAEAIKKASKS